jgi:FMN-dependent NADH-azoreductase
LAKEPLPDVSEPFTTGRLLGKDQRSPAEAKALVLSDILVGELLAADVVVLATPMHNFAVSASVKAWIDHIVRPGVTFSYSDKGPAGLAVGKKVILVLARGGIYSEGAMKQYDFQEPYLRAVLGFIGMTDIEVVHIEGVALGVDALRTAVTSAKAKADEIVRLIRIPIRAGSGRSSLKGSEPALVSFAPRGCIGHSQISWQAYWNCANGPNL